MHGILQRNDLLLVNLSLEIIKPYKSWQTREIELKASPRSFIMIGSCNSPALRVFRIALVKWIPIKANGYHGAVISSVADDPDSWTIRCARMG